jgi:hypothetical protein
LTNAIDANAYDIAFYLVKIYEDEIVLNSNSIIFSHVKSYQRNKCFLKSKLHMSKMLITIFNFNSAKEFLAILEDNVSDFAVDTFLFSHSNNPLLLMCLMYELLQMMIKKFYSLKNKCNTLMEKIMEMAINYIESVDDENFLTAVMLEQDYSGRDFLKIAVDLELLDLIQAPKVEAVIKIVYNSNYEQLGDLF